MSALVAWSVSVVLATVAIAITMAWVHPDKGQWKEFFRGVTGDVAGALLVAFFLSPVFLAIRAFANEKFGNIAEYVPMAGYERFPYLKFIERLERCDDLVRIMDTSSNVLDVTTAEAEEGRRNGGAASPRCATCWPGTTRCGSRSCCWIRPLTPRASAAPT